MNDRIRQQKTTLSRRSVSRFPVKSKAATRLDTRLGYILAGQIFTRLLYLSSGYKNLVPPAGEASLDTAKVPGRRPPSEKYTLDELGLKKSGVPRSHEDNVFLRSRFGNPENAEDYTYSLVDLTLYELRGGKYKKLVKILSDNSGAFDLKEITLRADKKYCLHAISKFNERFRAERISVRFKITKPQLTAANKYKIIDLKLTIKNQLRQGKGWKTLENEKVTVKLSRDMGKPVLWLGGPAALVFASFCLNVAPLNQEDEGNDLRLKYHDRETDEFNLTLKFKEKRWYLPIIPSMMCGVTCLTMVLRYLLGRSVAVKDVMLATAHAYMEENQKKPDYGLDPQRANKLALIIDEGFLPYAREKYLVKAAKKMLKDFWGEIAGNPAICTWRSYTPFGSQWRTTRAMIGAGYPVIAVEKGYRDVTHSVVVTGLVVDRKGRARGIYVNDPFTLKKTWPTRKACRGYLILLRHFSQREISGSAPVRLLNGGNAPPASRRQFKPREEKHNEGFWEGMAKG